MARIVLEAGCWFLLIFTPLAFGGVEGWALGTVQIVSGVMVGAWLWDRYARGELPASPSWAWSGMAAFVALFLLLGLLQIQPIPASWLSRVSPGAHHLYRVSVPGYDEGEAFDPARLPGWLLKKAGDVFPPGPDPPEPTSLQRATGRPIPGPERAISIVPPATRDRLTLYLCLAGVFLAASQLFGSPGPGRRLLAAVVIAAAAVSLLGIVQKAAWNGKLYWIRGGDHQNPFGPFVNRNNYAAFAGLALPLALCLAMKSLDRLRGGARDTWHALLFPIFATSLIGAGIAYSLSRAGIVIALASLTVAGLLAARESGGRRGRMAVTAGAILAILGFLFWIGPEATVERLGTLASSHTDPSLAGRLTAWTRSLDLMADHRLAGSGLGTYRFAFHRYAPGDGAWWTTAHNDYLEILCDTGLVGGFLLIGALVCFAIIVARASRALPAGSRLERIGIASGLAGLLAHCAFASHLHIPAIGVLFAVMAAGLCSMGDAPESSPGAHGSPRRRRAAATLIAALVLMNTAIGVTRIQASRHRHAGERFLASGSLDRAHTRIAAAIRWMPSDPETHVYLGKVVTKALANGLPLRAFDGLRRQEIFAAGFESTARGIALNPADPWGWIALADQYEALRAARAREEAMRRAGEAAPEVAEEDEEGDGVDVGAGGGGSGGTPSTGLDPEDRVAVAALLQAMRLDPLFHGTHDVLARLYWQRGLTADAGRHVRRAMALWPPVDGHATLEDDTMLRGLAEDVLAGIAESGSNPSVPAAMRVRARAEVLVRLDRLPEAMEAYLELRRIVPESSRPACDLALGEIEARRGRHRESLPYFLAAARSDAQGAARRAALFALGTTAERLQDHVMAARYFQEHLALAPGSIASYHALADVREKLGEFDEAERLYLGAVRRFPREAEPYHRLIEHLRRRGRPDEALKYAEALRRVDPEDDSVGPLIRALEAEAAGVR